MNFNENIKELNKMADRKTVYKERCNFVTVATNLHKTFKSLDSVIENSK